MTPLSVVVVALTTMMSLGLVRVSDAAVDVRHERAVADAVALAAVVGGESAANEAAIRNGATLLSIAHAEHDDSERVVVVVDVAGHRVESIAG